MSKDAFKIENTLSTAADKGCIRATIFAAADQCGNAFKCSIHQDIISTNGDVSAAFAFTVEAQISNCSKCFGH